MCGEKTLQNSTKSFQKGSPPRVWGKAVEWENIELDERITPTCVGKSCRMGLYRSEVEDHPHVCGEKQPCDILNPTFTGSPPRVWGKAVRQSF